MKLLVQLLLFSLALLISFNSFGQDDVKRGQIVEYYRNGNIKSTSYYVNGKEQGIRMVYYKSGEVHYKVNYVDGKQQGEVIYYFEDTGAVSKKYNIVDCKKQGEEIHYYYYPIGAVEMKANYVDDKLQGEFIKYQKSGAVKSKYNYVDGKLQGEMIKYYPNGEVEYKENYIDGIKQGEVIFYFPSGAVKSKYNYVDGKLQGEMIKYYPNGEVEYKENYIDGLPQGEEINISFFSVENYPVYPGCKVTNAMIRKCFSEKISIFVKRNFNTDLAVDLGLTGRIRVWGSFKIDKGGNVIDVKARAPHPILEEEVQRVINLLPKMKPAKQGGKAVIVPFSLPITFEVAENTIFDSDAEKIIIRDM